MTDAWSPFSNGSWDSEDWPRPEGPSEWDLFRKWAAPKIVMSDAAAAALERGDPTDHLMITFADGRMTVEAQMGVWDHIFKALYLNEDQCAECKEVLDVFRRVAESVDEEEEDNG